MPPGVHTIRIAPVSLEIAPGKIIKTTGYNGAVPDSALRLKERQPVKSTSSMTAAIPTSFTGVALPALRSGWSDGRRIAQS
jgi:hypothetical protein